MKLHHDKHHQAYVTNLNGAIEKHPEFGKHTPEDLLRNINTVPEDIRTVVRNNGGGHVNHTMFWNIMRKGGGGDPTGKIAEQIPPTSATSKPSRRFQRNHRQAIRLRLGMARLRLRQAQDHHHSQSGSAPSPTANTPSSATTYGSTPTTSSTTTAALTTSPPGGTSSTGPKSTNASSRHKRNNPQIWVPHISPLRCGNRKCMGAPHLAFEMWESKMYGCPTSRL